jgi:hyaluronoglucosaminidase
VAWGIRGLIEGFYGEPWSWDARAEVMRWCHERGMTHYVYAPKDDPLHRRRWREPYPETTLRAFERLVSEETLTVGFALSPGLSIDYDSPSDREVLLGKLLQMVEVGCGLLCLALDDIPPRPGLGSRHADLTAWLVGRLPSEVTLVLVPTEYTGTASTPYLDALAAGVPREVPIAWTGRTVVCDTITRAEATARAEALGGRAPLVWDNFPVNDAIMSDRLFLGPLEGRDEALAGCCSGYLANPMVQPHASLLPLTSSAAYLRGEDPVEAWQHEARARGLQTFAEACDGRKPLGLVRRLASAEPNERDEAQARLGDWIEACLRPDVAGDLPKHEVGPWVEQLSDELGLWSSCLRLLRALSAGDVAAAMEEGLGLAYLWPIVRRGEKSVLGARCSFRPVLGQDAEGRWRYERSALEEDVNATDALVRIALHALADSSTA